MIIPEAELVAPIAFDRQCEFAKARYPKRGMLITPSPLYLPHLKVRVKKIINAIVEEIWTPMGIRCHLIEFINNLEHELFEIKHRLTVVMWQLHGIALEIAGYKEQHPDSELIAQIIKLDQEINSPDSHWMLHPELCAS
ncbi:MAG: hypothetical protein ACSHX4_03785 [Opitutaceae bacterium]